MNSNNCPSCLKPGYAWFCPACRKHLFGGKKVSPVLPFSRPDYNARKRAYTTRLSISGVQSKHSVRLSGSELTLCEDNGEYILKPISIGEFEGMNAMPANEHVTMQIAKQLFKIPTADCAVVRFNEDRSPAYLVKRFDLSSDGVKTQQEDFAQISQVTEENSGKNYKYDASYEKIAQLMRRYVSTYLIEVEKFFSLVIFNYLVNNGDAHLKNFSLCRNSALGSYVLTPAYDLLNTRLHLPNDTPLALNLFESDFETESFKVNGFYSRDDFTEFGRTIGIPVKRIERIITTFSGKEEQVNELLSRSFLDPESRERYSEMVHERTTALNYSFTRNNVM